MAAGIAGSSDADRRKQCRGRAGDQSRNVTVSGSRRGGMPDRAVGRRSGRGGTLRGNAARPFDKACAGALARWRAFGRSYQGVLAIQRGNLGIGLRLLRAGFDEPGAAESILRFFTFLMAEA